MTKENWEVVDRYITETLVGDDPVLERCLARSAKAGLPAISVSAPQGKFLHLLAHLKSATRILEIGTLGGYSTIWLARGLYEGGRVVTLEIDAKHAEVARENFRDAGVDAVIEIRLGAAADTLQRMVERGGEAFDLIFIDADKANIPTYFRRSLELSRPGTVIIVDNVVRGGAVVDENSEDPNIQGVREFNRLVAEEQRVSATAIQTVGSKGYDGFAMVIVTGSGS